MAMPRKVPVEFGVVFPYGAYAVGEVSPVRDYDRSTRENPVQATDPDTGLLVWAVDVVDADPDAKKSTRTMSVKVAAKVQPVLPEAAEGMPVPPGRVRQADRHRVHRGERRLQPGRLVAAGRRGARAVQVASRPTAGDRRRRATRRSPDGRPLPGRRVEVVDVPRAVGRLATRGPVRRAASGRRRSRALGAGRPRARATRRPGWRSSRACSSRSRTSSAVQRLRRVLSEGEHLPHFVEDPFGSAFQAEVNDVHLDVSFGGEELAMPRIGSLHEWARFLDAKSDDEAAAQLAPALPADRRPVRRAERRRRAAVRLADRGGRGRASGRALGAGRGRGDAGLGAGAVRRRGA